MLNSRERCTYTNQDVQKFNTPDDDLQNILMKTQVADTLKKSRNGIVTGLDGLSYELWKVLHAWHTAHVKHEQLSSTS